ncbi:PREDICTED: pentatricopeptide repeat-containing protein At5g65560-like [Fragaria vesca subsp. vesca]|uniref:pentatricopeptide repeat-containing protein At5g65560-like n=1 Tax=Fragaria vesca subsp. vesca TaxID=101020 RepID=UPI0002C31680|nr:PREDICTED: pentatricopeptide repeat-containing protein At5g65560-like [Fragaria vesca subsp. vesca]
MAARLFSRSLRSLASNSFFSKQATSHIIPISASSSSSSVIQPKLHKRNLLFPSTSPISFNQPNFTCIRLFSSQPNPKAVTLTSIIHEHAQAGRTKDALDVYRKFFTTGIFPEYETYIALITALAADLKLVGYARECVLHMMTKTLDDDPDVGTYLAVYDGFMKQGKADEGKRFLREIKDEGLCGVDEESVREALKDKAADEVQEVIDILMDDKIGKSTRPLESLNKTFKTVDTLSKNNTCEDLVKDEDFIEKVKTGLAFVLRYECSRMFDALIEDGLTEEAMEIRASILDKGQIPRMVFFTGWINSIDYVPDCTEEALEVFQRMLSVGIAPNAYTYTVLIKVLVKDPKFIGDAKKYLLEMVNKGMRPNAKTYKSVVEAFAGADRVEECWELMKQMKAKGIELN